MGIARKRHFGLTTKFEWKREKSLVVPYLPCLEKLGKQIKGNGSDVDMVFKFNNTIKKKVTHNTNKDTAVDKGVYVIPCLDCDEKYVGETGRGLDIRLDEHKRACLMGMENSAVANHTLDLDHRIGFKKSKIVYKDADMGRRRVVEGAVIHCSKTFKNNKSFSEEDDILSYFIFNSVKNSKGAADTLGDPLLSIAGARGVPNLHNPGVGAGDVPVYHQQHHHEIRNEQQDAPRQNQDILPRRSARLRNRALGENIPGD